MSGFVAVGLVPAARIVERHYIRGREPGRTRLPFGMDRGLWCHLIACGLIGEPVPPVMISGGPQKKNSYTPSAAQCSASSLR